MTSLAAFYLPVTVMVILYFRIFLETRRRQKELQTLQASGKYYNIIYLLLSNKLIIVILPYWIYKQKSRQISYLNIHSLRFDVTSSAINTRGKPVFYVIF